MTDRRTITLDGDPNLAVLFARAAATSFGRAGRAGHGGALEDVEVRRPAVRIERTRLAAYDRVCGFGLRDTLPATYLHVLVFPLQVALMADRASRWGCPAWSTCATGSRRTGRSTPPRSSACARAPGRCVLTRRARWSIWWARSRVGEELVWEGVSTYLARGASVPGEIEPEQPVTVDLRPDARANAIWRVPADMGRRYAASAAT